MKLLRKLFKGISLTAAMFVFQACYGTGEDQFVLSPASVDMGGLWAVARQQDFDNLTLHDVRLILMDVCLSPEDVEEISENLHEYYSKKITH